MLIKYRVHEVAKDFDVPSKDVVELLKKHFGETKKHMTALEAAMVARDSRSEMLCLQHYSPRYSDRELKILLNEAKSIFENTVLTKDRMTFEIPLKD